MHPTRAPVKQVLMRLSCIMVVAGVLLPLTYLIPPIDLTGPIPLAAYWTAESGGTVGTPVIAISMAGLLLARPRLSWKQRGAELLVMVLALATLFGGAAYLNEFVVKPYFAIPRPDIIELAKPSPDKSVLKMSADEFYEMPTKAMRSEHLKKVLTPDAEPPMDEYVRRHWIHESGYSFPSGHSFSAMLVATVFLALGLSYFSQARLWVFYVLVAWALAVCYSRPILRVHSPTDVCVGGLEGIVCGVLAFLLICGILKFICPETVPITPSSIRA
jgi:membrane-associated phospholipid phosphatase